MKARQTFGVAVTGAIFALAMAGSMHGLVVFAEEHGMAAHVTVPIGSGLSIPLGTLAFVACFDGFAISLIPQIHDEDGIDPWALGALAVLTALSAVIQYLAAPLPELAEDAWKVKLVYTSPPIFAEVAAAFTVRRLLTHKSEGASTGRSASSKNGQGRSTRTGAGATSKGGKVSLPPPPPSEVLAVERGATLTSLDEARRKGPRRTQESGAGPHTEDEILRRLDTYFKSINKAPSKRSVIDAVRHTICGTKDKPGSCSDKRALEYLAKLNDMRQTGT